MSGPERLVLPALAAWRGPVAVVNLREERIGRLRDADPLKEYAESFKLEYRPIPVSGRWDSRAIDGLRELLGRLKPVLVHAHDVKASAYVLQAHRSEPANPYRLVSTHHGIHGRPDWKTKLYEWLYRRFLLKSFDRILSVSSADYQSLLRAGIDAKRLRLHLNGVQGHFVDAAGRRQESQALRAQWLPNEPPRDRLFLFGVVGRLSAEKNHARLLRVLSHLDRLGSDQDWRCVIVGAGPLENTLRQQAIQLGLAERILWLGYRKEVGNELAALDLLLSFSKAEGLPINLIEAGWAGTPVMSTKVGGVIDLIPDERYGNWIAPDESAAQTAQRLKAVLSKEGRARLENQGKLFQERIVRDFTQDKWLERLEEVYSELRVSVPDAMASPA